MSRNAETLAALVRSRAGDMPPRLGLILGSGLGHLAAAVDGVSIPYSTLPGFPHAGVSGHNPNLVIGDLEGVRVAVFGGRAHYYETGNPSVMRLPLEVLKALLRSDLVTQQVRAYSVQMRGGSLRYQAQTLRRIRLPRLAALSDNLLEQLAANASNQSTDALDELAKESFDVRSGVRVVA